MKKKKLMFFFLIGLFVSGFSFSVSKEKTSPWDLLKKIVLIPGVSGHEGRVGFFPQMYEGHVVVVYSKKGPIEGVVSPRSRYFERDSSSDPFKLEDIEIYLGVSSEEEARLDRHAESLLKVVAQTDFPFFLPEDRAGYFVLDFSYNSI